MIIDTHAHLNLPAFVRDREKVAKKCLDENIWVINVGTYFLTSRLAVELANKFDKGIYASIGLHPMVLGESDKKDSPFEKEFDYAKYKKLGKDKKVVAIGETGLDYFYKTEENSKALKLDQELLFLQHIKLANELNLPLIIHCRMAHQDILRILEDQKDILHRKHKGVIHCFTGNVTQLTHYLDLGFHIGFNGIIFKLNLKDVIKKTPLNRMVLETDCPFLGSKKRNDPFGVKEVAKEVAEIKGITTRELVKTTTENAKKLFGLV